MLREIYDISINMLLDALEMFCSVLVVPTPKILRTSFIISIALLVFSGIGYIFEFFVFADWYECVVCSVMIAILWGISVANESNIKAFHDKIADIKTASKKKGEK